MKFTIRSEQASDVAAIEAVTRKAFLDAPHTSHTEQYIVNALRRTGQLAVSLVAQRDGEIIGHVAASPVAVSDGTPSWYGLGPVSVLPAYQRCGIGTKLVSEALASLRGLGAAGCVLVGEPAYYGRFGFRAEPGLRYPDVPGEYFLALSFCSSLPRGIVTYHAAFGADQ